MNLNLCQINLYSDHDQVSCCFLSTGNCAFVICDNQAYASDVLDKKNVVNESNGVSFLALVLPISTVDPCDADRLKDDNDHQRQSGRIIIEHGHKVVPAALGEQQTNQEAQDAADH